MEQKNPNKTTASVSQNDENENEFSPLYKKAAPLVLDAIDLVRFKGVLEIVSECAESHSQDETEITAMREHSAWLHAQLETLIDEDGKRKCMALREAFKTNPERFTPLT